MFNQVAWVINYVIEMLGKLAALFILAIIAIMCYEMAMRGLFGHSSPWAGDLSSWLLVGFIFLGGPWALARGHFVRVDVAFDRFSPMTRALIDSLVSTVLFMLFAGVLLRFGGEFALRSFAIGERSATGAWSGPVWIAKAMVPLGSGFLCLAWISHLLRAWRTVRYPETSKENV